MTTMNQLSAWEALRNRFILGVHTVSYSELGGLSDRTLRDIGAPRGNQRPARPTCSGSPASSERNGPSKKAGQPPNNSHRPNAPFIELVRPIADSCTAT
jgi:hypothetical protein